MNNVKQGDFARIVWTGHYNDGKHVSVLRPEDGVNFYSRIYLWRWGPSWECQPLQPIAASCLNGPQKILMSVVTIPDQYLRRIDSPEDGEALWSTEPIHSDELSDIKDHNHA